MLLPNPVFRIVVSNRRRRDQSRNDQKYAAHHDAARSHSFSVNFFRSSAAILSASSCAFLVCLGAVTTVGRQPRIGSRRTDTNTPPINSLRRIISPISASLFISFPTASLSFRPSHT